MRLPRACNPALRRIAALLVAGSLAAAVQAQAASAVFTLQDATNLTPGSYQIYVTGYSANTPYVLQQDGSWALPAAVPAGKTATLPCYRFPQDITQIQVYNTANSISARVYYFIVTDLATFPSCTPTGSNSGLFNFANAFTYTDASIMNLSQPPTSAVSDQKFPAWTFSEIGASAAAGTIDLSQVDFFAFPMDTRGTVSSGASVMGNPVGATNPGTVVNYRSIADRYRNWINARAREVSGKSCADDETPIACAYLDLLQDITTGGSSVPQYVIQNPGGYLAEYSATTQASKLNHAFDAPIAALWESATAPALSIRTGGILNGVPDDVFTSTIVTIPYPNANPPLNVRAMKFTGSAASGNYVAYVVDPNDYNTGCQSGAIANCVNASSPGYQVFAGAGVFNTPTPDTYNTLLAGGYLSATAATYGVGGYQAIVARLGFLISGAMNRGVALVDCGSNATWTCWQDGTYWYPTKTGTTFPDITQNLFARWMHVAQIGGVPMFVQPPGAINGATDSPGKGPAMGMAYGFSNDENPTPAVPSPPALVSPQPEVPSKFDQTVVFGGAGTITFGPWVAPPTTTPTLTVVNAGGGTVTSTPGDIECGTTCSQSYPSGTTVTLTAAPGKSALFWEWKNACSGSSTTCTVTLDQSKTVVAVFGAIAASPAKVGLHVVVSGPGSVASAPSGIACGSACSTAFASGTQVTLTASPTAGAAFSGWSGACSGNAATCVVSLAQARTVAATFTPAGGATVAVTASDGGSVVSDPAGIDCGTRCTAAYVSGTTVRFDARPKPGYRFAGWSGACTDSATCTLDVNGNVALQASFVAVAPGMQSLTVRGGSGGSVQSSPPGIACGSACSAAFAGDTRVALFAVAQAGYRFAGWSGACSGTGACTVYVDDTTFVEARFVRAGVGASREAPIPTLSQWALLMLAALLVLAAVPMLRRDE
ncbi:MAG: IPTL-CTERM sorting domain-containing protein [Burkholderiales bacterium]|nr:IPTL-CTERM sorting domain-containing protein [Burkholderiales bacterium]